jgi:hypothetical protein
MNNQTSPAAAGLFFSGVGLESLLDDLNHSGSRSEDVCVLLPQNHSVSQSLHTLRSGACSLDSAPEIASVIEWLSQFGAVIIPGVGMFVSGREFAGTLFGCGNGERACDNALQELGLATRCVRHCEDWLRGGGIVVYVSCAQDTELGLIASVLEEAGAEELLYSEEIVLPRSVLARAS